MAMLGLFIVASLTIKLAQKHYASTKQPQRNTLVPIPVPLGKADHWQNVGNTPVLVYSAYYDHRIAIGGQYKPPFIRIMGFAKPGKVKLYCQLMYEFGEKICIQKPLTWQQVNPTITDFPNLYYDYMFLCEIDSKERIPEHVSVSDMPNCSNSTRPIPVRGTLRPNDNVQFTVCMGPIFEGFWTQEHLVRESLEMKFLLGADKILMYIQDNASGIKSTFAEYARTGRVIFIDWKLPLSSRESFYHGQSLLINDCLYRSMAITKYTVYMDLDEHIIPHSKHHNTWARLIRDLHRNDVGAWYFKNVFFINDKPSPEFPPFNMKTVDPAYRLKTLPQVVTKRIRTDKVYEPPTRSKYIVEADRIVRLGVHLVWEFLPGYIPFIVDQKVALLHHFKPRGGFWSEGKRCFLDNTTDRYVPALMKAMHEQASRRGTSNSKI